jgi:hypothetical protein
MAREEKRTVSLTAFGYPSARFHREIVNEQNSGMNAPINAFVLHPNLTRFEEFLDKTSAVCWINKTIRQHRGLLSSFRIWNHNPGFAGVVNIAYHSRPRYVFRTESEHSCCDAVRRSDVRSSPLLGDQVQLAQSENNPKSIH